jgi:hypothetical protein
MGKLAESIEAYKRALFPQSPTDEDAKYNLEYVAKR